MKIDTLKIGALYSFVILLFITSVSCSDDDSPAVVIEGELITNITLTFTNTADPLDTVVMTSVAPNGQSGASNEDVNGTFNTGSTYALTLAITNASENPADDVLNDDIIPEADEHFFVYAVNGIDITVTRDASDVDGPNGSKLGVSTTWTAGSISNGSLQIRLIHEPTSVDDSNGFGSASGGSEDFNIVFNSVAIL